jgi:hypothetical protein
MTIHPVFEQRMPKELKSVAYLSMMVGETANSPNQFRALQLGEVLLRLTFPHADFRPQRRDGRVTIAVLAGIPRQSPVCELRAWRDSPSPDQKLRDENSVEQTKGVEWLTRLETPDLGPLRGSYHEAPAISFFGECFADDRDRSYRVAQMINAAMPPRLVFVGGLLPFQVVVQGAHLPTGL